MIPAPINPGSKVERIAIGVYLENDRGRGAILHAHPSTIVSLATRFGFNARPHCRPGRELATIFFTANKVAIIRVLLDEPPEKDLEALLEASIQIARAS